MSWTWVYESAAGDAQGRSEVFESRSEAESWIGEAFGDLLDQQVDQVRLLDGETEVYGPMSLHAENN